MDSRHLHVSVSPAYVAVMHTLSSHSRKSSRSAEVVANTFVESTVYVSSHKLMGALNAQHTYQPSTQS